MVDGAADTADLVTDTLTDIAESAVELVAEGGEALAVASAGRLIGLLKRPKALLAVLIIALVGAWLYRRYIGGDDSVDEASSGTQSLQR